MGTVVSRHPPPTSSHQHINITLFVAASCHPQSVLLGAGLIHNKGLGNLLSIPLLHERLLSSVQDFSSFISIYNCNCNCYHLVCAAHGASVGTMQGAGGGSV